MKYYKDITCIKTFMKYPGNKTRLLKQITPYVPDDFQTYFEPFLGSGAMYLCIQPEKAVINDINKDVVNVWKHVKKNPDKLYEHCRNLTLELETYQTKQDKLKWAREKTNELNNNNKYNLERAGLYLFLLEICFNHNLRHKTKNEYYFHGLYKKKYLTKYLDNNNLNISIPITCKILCKDYKEIIKEPVENDFVYLDPPYIHNTSSPIIYNEKNEATKLILDIKNEVDLLTQKKIKVMLSMSDFPEIRNLFNCYKIIDIRVYRGYTNTFCNELLIMNY